MTLQVLNNMNPPLYIPLKQGHCFNGIDFQDGEMHTNHAQVVLDSSFSWKINGLSGNKLRVSTEEVSSISLIPGLVFHIGQTGFKVVERPLPDKADWETRAVNFLENPKWIEIPPQEFFFFLRSIQLIFIQGPQTGESYTLSYGPRYLGFNNLDINLKDPLFPHQLIKFSQIGDSVSIENLSETDNLIQINKEVFKKHKLKNGDQIYFGSNIIEIRF